MSHTHAATQHTGTRRNRTRESYQVAGSIGGLTTAALTVDRKKHTKPARDARFRKYLDQIPPEITDPADRRVRAELLRRADMKRLSSLAAAARTRARQARETAEAAEAELAELGGDAA